MEGLLTFRPQNILTIWVMVIVLFGVVAGVGLLWPKGDGDA